MGTEDEIDSAGVAVEASGPSEGSETIAAPGEGQGESPRSLASNEPPVADAREPVALAPEVEGAEFIKSRETVRRPPLPEPSLYDACVSRPRRVRRPVVTEDDPTPTPEPPPREDSRFVSPDQQLMNSTVAFAALDAWVEIVPPRKKAK